jgi:hypothetical protein
MNFITYSLNLQFKTLKKGFSTEGLYSLDYIVLQNTGSTVHYHINHIEGKITPYDWLMRRAFSLNSGQNHLYLIG